MDNIDMYNVVHTSNNIKQNILIIRSNYPNGLLIKRLSLLFLLTIFLVVSPSLANADTGTGMDNVSGAKLDHLMIKVQNASSSFELFKAGFKMPSSWNVTDYKYYISGGINAGNVNIETFEVPESAKIYHIYPERDGIVGLIFQPVSSLNESVKILDEKRIPHSDQEVSLAGYKDGVPVTFTNVYLDPFMNNSMVLFCNYSYNMDERRKNNEEILSSLNGGSLGILGLTRVDITYSNATVRYNWQKFLPAVNVSSPDVLDAGNGVTISLIPGDADAIPSVFFDVRSVNEAEKELKALGIPYTVNETSLVMQPSELPDLSIILNESN
jgi:hypothetical protein